MRTYTHILQLKAELFIYAGLFFASINTASGQNNVKYADKPRTIVTNVITGFDETSLRQRMKQDGIPVPVMDKLVEQHRQLFLKGKNISWTQVKRKSNTPITNASCGDLGAENGWGAWLGDIGAAKTGSLTLTPPPTTPTAPNFCITKGAGIDACTPGPDPGSPPIPVVAPGFGNASIRLGEIETPGSFAEQITYPLTVTPQDINFIYAYAMVLENPVNHMPDEKPWAGFCIYDANGIPIPCADFKYVADSSLAGFYKAKCKGAYYKPWTLVGVDLSAYINQTITVVITNADCSLGAHFAQSYWDFSCGDRTVPYCLNNPIPLCAPNDPMIAYTYQWYHNGSPISGGTTKCITPVPAPGDTFSVEVKQPSGCDFHFVFIPEKINIQADFTYTKLCEKISFQDITASHTAAPITRWNWLFPGGSPATANTQIVTVDYPAAGTYTATLIVETTLGCTDTLSQQVVVYRKPMAHFSDTATGCAPLCNQFTDLSDPVDGNIVSWKWSFPGGTPPVSTLQNPTICYNVPDSTYGVTLTVTTNHGCNNTHTINSMITTLPTAKAEFSVTPQKASADDPVFSFSDKWTPNSGVVKWHWDFGDGSPLDTINTAPVHSYSATTTGNDSYTYSVCLYIQNQYGCWDSICHTVEILPDFVFYIPNSFTPNGDGANEMFYGKGRGIKEYDIWVFDRWGNVVWDCHYAGPNTEWDNQEQDGMPSACKWNGNTKNGRSNNSVQEDVYVWKVNLIDVFDKKHTYNGHVSVVK